MSRLRPLMPTGRKCPDCQQVVPDGAKVCLSCKAYQDWRRFVPIGQTNLALIVAALSILTTLFSVVLPLTQPSDADLKIMFVSEGGSHASFFVRNNGRSGGSVVVTHFVFIFDTPDGRRHGMQLPLRSEPVLIRAGAEDRLSATTSPDLVKTIRDTLNTHGALRQVKTLSEVLSVEVRQQIEDALADIECGFDAYVTTFSRSYFQIRVDAACNSVSLMRDAILDVVTTSAK
jgi:RNA polymerase subunit RPABC4/transcription elongation factor Spt4